LQIRVGHIDGARQQGRVHGAPSDSLEVAINSRLKFGAQQPIVGELPVESENGGDLIEFVRHE
jgi:hypothetical protein